MLKHNRIETTPVDSGYSWVVLIATTCLYLMIGSTFKSFAILYAEFLIYFDTGSGNTAWIGSVYAFLFLGLSPVSNRLAEMFSFRTVVFCGGIMHSLGIFLSAFVHRMEMLYLTYGILSGIGAGLIFVPTNTILNFYFEKRRALANGIMISGGGASAMFYPYLYRYLIDSYGIQGALMILSGILANVCVCASLLRQPEQLVRKLLLQDRSVSCKTEMEAENEKDSVMFDYEIKEKICKMNSNQTRKIKTSRKFSYFKKVFSVLNFTDCSLLRNPSFTMYVLAFVSNVMAYSANYSAIAKKILDLGFSNDMVPIALSISGLAEIVSKLVFGCIMNLKIFKVKTLLLFIFLGGGISTAIIPFFTNFIAYAVYAGILGALPGSYVTFIAVSLLQCIRLMDLAHGFGLATMFMSFAAVISHPTAGWIEDASGNWDYSLWFIACWYLLSAMLLFCEPLFNKYWCFQNKTTEEGNKT